MTHDRAHHLVQERKTSQVLSVIVDLLYTHPHCFPQPLFVVSIDVIVSDMAMVKVVCQRRRREEKSRKMMGNVIINTKRFSFFFFFFGVQAKQKDKGDSSREGRKEEGRKDEPWVSVDGILDEGIEKVRETDDGAGDNTVVKGTDSRSYPLRVSEVMRKETRLQSCCGGITHCFPFVCACFSVIDQCKSMRKKDVDDESD